MKTNLLSSFLISSFFVIQTFTFSLENSITPLLEKFENLDNLSSEKYTSTQLSEIKEGLKQKENRIRVLSYNMLFNEYDHNLEEQNRWPSRLPRIAELIQEMQPDIIGSQELYHTQVQDLLALLSEDYEFFGKPCMDGEENGIFYRKKRFEVVESLVTDMAQTADVSKPGTLTMLQLKDKKTNHVFAVFNTHLAFSNIEKREMQAQFIAEYLEIYTKKMPVILTGDLNTFSNRPDLDRLPFYDGDYIHRILTKSSLRHAKEHSLLGHLGPIGTFTNSENDILPFKGIGTPGIFLDHIYVSKNITVLIHAVQPATVKGRFPSDHMPIVVDFVLKPDLHL